MMRGKKEVEKEWWMFEGLFDMVRYGSMKKWIRENEICVGDEWEYVVVKCVSKMKVVVG